MCDYPIVSHLSTKSIEYLSRGVLPLTEKYIGTCLTLGVDYPFIDHSNIVKSITIRMQEMLDNKGAILETISNATTRLRKYYSIKSTSEYFTKLLKFKISGLKRLIVDLDDPRLTNGWIYAINKFSMHINAIRIDDLDQIKDEDIHLKQSEGKIFLGDRCISIPGDTIQDNCIIAMPVIPGLFFGFDEINLTLDKRIKDEECFLVSDDIFDIIEGLGNGYIVVSNHDFSYKRSWNILDKIPIITKDEMTKLLVKTDKSKLRQLMYNSYLFYIVNCAPHHFANLVENVCLV